MIEDMIKFFDKFKFAENVDIEKLQFRMGLLTEEFLETQKAMREKDAEEFVDGHIDVIVIAIGNLLAAGVDVQKAWDEVARANMSKKRGVKPGREQSGGYDVMKPKGWKAPSHKDNHGRLDEIFSS